MYVDTDSLDKLPSIAEASASSCLLDLSVTELAAASLYSQDSSDLLLASSLPGQLLGYSDPVTQNGRESDPVSTDMIAMSADLSLLTLNGVEHRESSADTNHLVTDDTNTDILSQIDNALASYIDGSSEAV